MRIRRLAFFSAAAVAWLGTLGVGACGSGASESEPAAEADTRNQQPPRPGPDASSDLDARLDGSRDALVFETGEPDRWADAGACNDLVSTSSLVSWTFVARPPPTFTGGAIEPGVYELTKIEMFRGGASDASPAAPRSQTWRLLPADGGFLHGIAAWEVLPDGGVGRGRAGGTLVVREDLPNVLSLKRSCPGPTTITIDFEFEFSGTGPGATLAIYYGSDFPLVETYTKR
ncbi:MAG: hypothetical protein JST00_37495 [Deltaproteobacteria bacterium]|nr:hypothetical protein [Deltaproteobacteria bacterium]